MTKTLRGSLATLLVITILGVGGTSQRAGAADTPDIASEYFTYEFYYKVRWGFFNEWMDLYKKNHYPILERLQDMGRIVHMEAAFPIDHVGEADRWDLRFTIVYPDVQTAFEDFDRTAILEELYPDQETFKKEEQRRFELLDAHRDAAVRIDNLSDW